MNRAGIIVGIAALAALALIGYLLLVEPETPSSVTLKLGPGDTPAEAAPEAVPPPAAAVEPEQMAPAEAPAGEPASAEAAAAAPEAVPPPAAALEPEQMAPAEAPAGEPASADSAPSEASAGETTAALRPAGQARQESAAVEQPVGPVSPSPSFDVVRVERSGEAVIAGRAVPRSVVTVFDGRLALGSAAADLRGQWVLVLDTPLSPGNHELSLESTSAEGEVLISENIVVVSVPQSRLASSKQPESGGEPAPTKQVVTQDRAAAAVQAAPAEPAATQDRAAAAVQAAPVEPAVTQDRAAAQARPALAERSVAPDQIVSAMQPPAAEQGAVAPRAAPPAPAAQLARAAQPALTAPPDTAARIASAAPVVPETAPATGLERPLVVLMPRRGQGRIRILQQPGSASEGPGEEALSLQTVDYDAAGKATIGGRAQPGARLVLYLDAKPQGRTVAGADGRWRLTLGQPVPEGLHQIRVDQVDDVGKVTARVETPFSRAAMVASLPDETSVIVQPGNSLWRIARRIYGKGLRYAVIYQANKEQIRDPDLIYPGQIFVVPAAN